MENKINLFNKKEISSRKLLESFQGWSAYAKWADSFKIRKEILKKLIFK